MKKRINRDYGRYLIGQIQKKIGVKKNKTSRNKKS